jgi:hypothetical protein
MTCLEVDDVDNPNNIYWTVEIMEFLVAHMSASSFHFLSLRSMYILFRTHAETPSMYVLFLGLETKFHVHVKQQIR